MNAGWDYTSPVASLRSPIYKEAAEEIELDGRPTYVYVLTDFDPSGVSIAEKVEAELTERAPGADIAVERLAVNREQIDRWQLPTRPT